MFVCVHAFTCVHVCFRRSIRSIGMSLEAYRQLTEQQGGFVAGGSGGGGDGGKT